MAYPLQPLRRPRCSGDLGSVHGFVPWGSTPSYSGDVPKKPSPVGVITRGTTNPNRLRRVDRWIAATHRQELRASPQPPIVVDLGYGASPITAVELSDRLRAVRADVEVLGLEIDPARVAAARELERPGLSFAVGGFEVPAKRPVEVIRAFNVLRQYDEAAVPDAWAMMTRRLTPTGVLVEGTCAMSRASRSTTSSRRWMGHGMPRPDMRDSVCGSAGLRRSAH